MIEKGRKSPCCENGESHTPVMQKQFEELQDMPPELKKLITDEKLSKIFLPDTMTWNNSIALASIKSERQTDIKELGGYPNTLKVNGKFFYIYYL